MFIDENCSLYAMPFELKGREKCSSQNNYYVLRLGTDPANA